LNADEEEGLKNERRMNLISTILPSTGTTERERVVVRVAVRRVIIDRAVQQPKRVCKRNTYKKEKKR